MCHGLWQNELKIGDKLYDLSVLRKSSEVGRTIKGEVVWYAEPYYQNDFKESTISGTIRSVNCKHILYGSKNGTCSKCDPKKPLSGKLKDLIQP